MSKTTDGVYPLAGDASKWKAEPALARRLPPMVENVKGGMVRAAGGISCQTNRVANCAVSAVRRGMFGSRAVICLATARRIVHEEGVVRSRGRSEERRVGKEG